MFGLALTSLGTLLQEISTSIGKWEVGHRRESLYTFGVLNLIWGGAIFSVLVLAGKFEFVFGAASWPTFLARALLELVQIHVTLIAITRADRSSMGFVRAGTIPLLLLADIFLGYKLAPLQILGVAVILAGILFFFFDRQLPKQGMGFALFGTVNAVFTISLYKYNVTNFNSVAGEQLLMHAVLLAYLFTLAYFFAKENPLSFLRRRVFFAQSAADGLAGVLESFALAFLPPSVFIAAKRSFAILWSTLSGGIYFHEKHVLVRALLVLVLVAGIILLAG